MSHAWGFYIWRRMRSSGGKRCLVGIDNKFRSESLVEAGRDVLLEICKLGNVGVASTF